MESKFTPLELRQIRNEFQALDQANSGSISPPEVKELLGKLNLHPEEDVLDRHIREQDKSGSGRLTFDMVLGVVFGIRGGAAAGPHRQVVHTVAGAVGTHAYSDEEKTAFTEYINTNLAGDAELASILPIASETDDVFERCRSGTMLCKLVNAAKPGTIDERFINKKARISVFEMNENINLALNSAKSIGCTLVNIGPNDIMSGTKHLILGVLWQIIRVGLTRKINLVDHPELFRLLEEGETLESFRKQPPEVILLRWFNYHLQRANHPRRVMNFSDDVKDAINYTVLLHQIAPQQCDLAGMDEQDVERRAAMVLDNSVKLGCQRFIFPRDIVSGNHKLNLSFTAALFNAFPGLEPPPQEALDKLQVIIDEENSAESREERAFRNWINNLGIEGHIDNLFTDLQDGIVLLQIIDRLAPGKVDWRRVNRNGKLSVFKKNENTQYLIALSRELGCKIVGFDGRNITEGHKLYTLALVWQLMRLHVLNYLKEMSQSRGREITEVQLVEMANQKLQAANKQSRIRDFRDPAIRTAFPLLDLVAAVEPRAIDETLIKHSDPLTPDDRAFNAKYAIAAARKIGCSIFCVHEDITEGKDKLIMTFVGAVLSAQPLAH